MTLCLSAFAIVSFGLLTGYVIWAGINRYRARLKETCTVFVNE